MTKFQALCTAFKTSQDESSAYWRQSVDFAQKLFKGLWEYLQIPQTNYHYFPLGEEKQPTIYSVAGAIKLGNDGYWNLGFDITVHRGEDTQTKSRLPLIRS